MVSADGHSERIAQEPASSRGRRPAILPTLVHTGIPSLDDLLHLPPSSTFLTFSRDLHSSWSRLVARYFVAQGLLSVSPSASNQGGVETPSGEVDESAQTRTQNTNTAGGEVWNGQGGDEIIMLGDEESSRDLVKGCMWLDPRSVPSASGGAAGGDGGESGSDGEGAGVGMGAGGEDEDGSNRSKIAWRYASMSRFRTSAGESLCVCLLDCGPSLSSDLSTIDPCFRGAQARGTEVELLEDPSFWIEGKALA